MSRQKDRGAIINERETNPRNTESNKWEAAMVQYRKCLSRLHAFIENEQS